MSCIVSNRFNIRRIGVSFGLICIIFLLGICTKYASAASHTVHHQLEVSLAPQEHTIKVVDTITFPTPSPGSVEFSLHPALTPVLLGSNLSLERISALNRSVSNHYRVVLRNGENTFKLGYKGKINQSLEDDGKEQSRGFRSTTGIISSEGVFLSGSSNWYPQFPDNNSISFDLSIDLPDGWKAVSQGRSDPNTEKSNWHESHPQEEIYLIAARFYEYKQKAAGISTQVYLREADEKLAKKYLEATTQYLEMYQSLLGDYPYNKFALVENFWETGYGMPSFTLLGSKVIRLPFIINSSYPHEILHNWWGNGVYVDYKSGNWSEGLTAYLADHLIKQQQGKDAQYRQHGLQKYSDYASRKHDFALSQFRGRHSSASEAVGYGKSLMLFHMLRQTIGDMRFREGLQAFYQQYRFRTASFDNIRQVFEKISDKSLKGFFDQWVLRTGAPALQLEKPTVKKIDGGYRLGFNLQQIQSESAYPLDIPIAITLENTLQAKQLRISMKQKQQMFSVDLAVKPLRLDIDPEFDLFRKLAVEETPPAFTRVFGSKQLRVVLPRKANPELKKAYEIFAEKMQRMGPDKIIIQWDDELDSLPDDQAITLMGWENKFLGTFKSTLKDYAIDLDADRLKIDNNALLTNGTSIALVSRQETKNKPALSFIATDLPDALPGLARKLPHYHKYSHLAFTGTEPKNTLKGRWPITHSPMTAFLTDTAVSRGLLESNDALINPVSLFSTTKMLETINFLTQKAFQGRGFGSVGLDKVADMISDAFKAAGLQAGGDNADNYLQTWQSKSGDPERQTTLKNVIGILPGTNPAYAEQSIVIGAHYDHLGLGWPDVRDKNKGKVHYGADDNASGVAVLLELARVLGGAVKPERSIVFVAFTAEETGKLGSKYFVEQLKDLPNSVFAMINLDTVGRLNKGKLLVLGVDSAAEWQHIFRGIGFVSGVSISVVNEALDASDQNSFHAVRIPAVQLFSGANLDYHQPSDTAEKIDLPGLLKVAVVSKEAIDYLTSRKEPLSVTLDNGSNTMLPKQQRKVNLGTVPDFTWTGIGYRLDGVVPKSPAANSGLQGGDIIIRMADKEIAGIRDVSAALKDLSPGEKTSIVYLRGNKKTTIDVVLNEK